MSNLLVNQTSVLTTEVEFNLDTTSIVIPQGARTIDILNISPLSSLNIEITGNQAQGTLTLLPVIVNQNITYSFVDLGKPYPEITVSGDSGAVANIVACY
jgi:hypothetical protein